MSFLLALSKGIDRINDSAGRLAQWLALVMIIIGALNAILRYSSQFTGINLTSNIWIESQWYLFSLVFLLAGGYALRHDVHVRVDVIYGRLNKIQKTWIDLIGTIIFLIPFSVMMIWFSWDWVINSWTVLEQSPDPDGLARYPIKSMILIAFILLLLQGISQIIQYADKLKNGKTSSTKIDRGPAV